ncbi:MAG: hypothetical protein ACI4B5_06675 [Bacteroidaceae bacterium]
MIRCHRYILSGILLTCLLPLTAQAQQQVRIEEGYYLMSPFLLHDKGYVYGYDTDASRTPYGNAADYDHPCGRNGEVAYLYAQPSTSVSLVNSAYYFRPLEDGTYSVQSLSGQAYSYLSIAAYDRRLVCHTAFPSRSFSLKRKDVTEDSQWGEQEYAVQQFQYAALADSLVSKAPGMNSMVVLTPVDESRVTPAMSIRRALSDALGALAVYRAGENPGEVSDMMAYALTKLTEEAQVLVDDKNTTQEQATEMIASLRESTTQYMETAATALNPIEDGYYFLVNAYRAFMLRQSKEKGLSATPAQDGRTLTWRDVAVNDGAMAFRITPLGEDYYVMKSYDQSLVMDNMLFRYDAEGTWTVAHASDPDALMNAANNATSLKSLYGKNTADTIAFDREAHLYAGYTASWYLLKAYHQVTVPSTGWVALSVSFPVVVPEGVEVFSVSEKGGELFLVPYDQPVIPACTAVMIHAPKGTCTFCSTTHDAPNIQDNVMIPVNENLKDITSGSVRTFKVKNGVAGFAKVSSTSLSAGVAYIPYHEGEEDFLPLQEDENSISPVSEEGTNSMSVYDLHGRKVRVQEEGNIYIINHKKIMK